MNQPLCLKTLPKNLLSVAVASLISATTSISVEAARVEGRVTDSQQKVNFAGAQVRLEEINRTVSTGEDGRFVFRNVPEGTYTLKVDYVGADAVSQTLVVDDEVESQIVRIGENVADMDNIIVYGVSSQAATALNRQRSANTTMSVISSDRAGDLPDQNIAEALQRAPGVFIERDQGEGRFVAVRGLPQSLNTVSINGVNVPAPDSGERVVALDVIPADLLETIEVNKTFTPDQDAGSISGSINVKSLSGFDRNGQFMRFSVENNHNNLQEENSPKISATYSNAFDLSNGNELAIAASLSYEDREFGSENTEQDGDWEIVGGAPVTEEAELRDYQISRERLGFALNFDLRTSESQRFYLRTLYSDFEDAEIRNRIEIEPDADTVSAIGGGASFTEAEYKRSMKDRIETQEIISLVLGGETEVGTWSYDYALGFSTAEEDEPNRVDSKIETDDPYAFSYSNLGQIPNYSLAAEAYDANNFKFDDIAIENNLVEDEELSFKLDVARDIDFGGNPGEVKFGFKYRDREKERRSDIRVYDDLDFLSASDFVAGSPDYSLANFGFGLNANALRSTAFALGSTGLNAEESVVESSVGDYGMSEEIFAAYVMAQVDINRLRLVGGVRFEQTDFSSRGAVGSIYETDDPSTAFAAADLADGNQNDVVASADGVSFDGDYDYALPSIVARYKATDDLIIRGGLSQTISRPGFGAINPSALAEIEDEDGEVKLEIEELGNVDLDPYEAFNVDLSAEYYPGKLGVMSAAFFYKDIDNFIALTNVSDTINLAPWLILTPDLTAADIDDVDATQYRNGESATVAGVELAYIKNFVNGLTVGVNATFTDTEADYEDGVTRDLIGSADTVANLMLGYQLGGFSGRLAYNYTAERLEEIGGSSALDVYRDEHAQIDLSLKYDFNESFQVYLEGANLTDEPYYIYQGGASFNRQYEEYGRTFVLGLSYTRF
ncbi:TonB-dependent receptor [Aurantivibrio plasticivorans]